MNVNDIDFKYGRYTIENAQLIIGSNEPFNILNDLIASVYIEKDFDTYFPYFEMTIMVPFWVYNNITKNPNSVYMSLDMKYGLFSKDISNAQPMSSEMKGKFICVFEDVSPEITADKQLQVEKNQGVLNTGYGMNDTIPVTMALYNASYFETYDTIVNDVLSSATLTMATAYVCNKAKISNVLLGPPDNRKTYKEFKLPPIGAADNIHRICNQYGMHKHGTIVFFDFDCCYIVSKKPECNAYRPNEFQNTHLISLENYHSITSTSGGHFKNTREKYNVVNILRDSFTTYDNSTSGVSKITLIDSASGTTSSLDRSGKSTIQKERTYVFDLGSGQGDIIRSLITENTKTFMCGLSHVSLSTLSPNKCFILTIDDPKFKTFCGKYRISKYTCIFEKEGNYWAPIISAQFKGN